MLKFSFVVVFFIGFLTQGGSPLVGDAPLEKLFGADAFGLADGPSMNGSMLVVPDVKGGEVIAYSLWKKPVKRWIFVKNAGRISASYFSHNRHYVCDNGGSRVGYIEKGKIQTFAMLPNKARPNDLVVDRDGGIYVTLTKQGQVAYCSPEGKVSVVATDAVSANGIILSPDQKTLYVSSFAPKEILAYPVERPGALGSRRVFSTMDDGDAKGADGMSIDRAGNVYCAGANAIWIWNPEGKLIDRIVTPERPINCCFGDPDMRSLYITGFGGIYRQRMAGAYGLAPQPALAGFGSEQLGRKPATGLPAGVRALTNQVYAKSGSRKLLADVFFPAGEQLKRPAVVVIHGGGWLKGSREKFSALAAALAGKGYVVANIEYRLGFEAKFPAGVQDCFTSIRYLRANAGRFGIDENRIGVVGGSAGGHLAGLVASGWKEKALLGAEYANQSSRCNAAIVMAGPMEMVSGSVAERSKAGMESNAINWIGSSIDDARKVYELADAYMHIDKDTPPILFMAGEHDLPERNQKSREKLQSFGTKTGIKAYEDGKHGCWNQMPWFTDMVGDMDSFFKETL